MIISQFINKFAEHKRKFKRKITQKSFVYLPFASFHSGDKPYSQRREDILKEIEKFTEGKAVNRKWCWKTNTNDQLAKDLRRMLKDGDIKMIRKKNNRSSGTSFLVINKK